MSFFQEKIAALMARPGQDSTTKDETPWWLRFSGRTMGAVGGPIAIFLGVWNSIGILFANLSALIAGMWQIVAGFIVICIEAPCCLVCLDHVQRISDTVENRPLWYRAFGYVAMAIPPIIININFCTIFGSGLIFATGIIYGMMALGKKASREDMAAVASPHLATSPTGMGGPMTDQQRATLMEDPDVWRPT